MKVIRTLSMIVLSCISICAVSAPICPEMPSSITTMSRDFKTDISMSVGSFGRLKAGEVAVKAETVAKNLFDKYPNADRVLTIQMMFATYCSMVESAAIPDREKMDRLAAFSERLQNSNTTSASTASESMQGRQEGQHAFPRSSREPAKKAYDLAQDRRKEFLDLLATKQREPRDTLRIGCVAWSEAACLAAGKFLILFSEAGWKIDSDQVYKVESAIPVDGMSITTRSDEVANLEKLPPHKGRWVRTRPSEIVINMAFTQMGVPVHSSRDPSLPPDTLGINFGPEPALIPTSTAKISVRKQIVTLLSKGTEVEQVCAPGPNMECTNARASWETEVSRYLSAKHFNSNVINEWKLEKSADGSVVERIGKEKNWLVLLFYRLR